ncbi:MAG: elongation factor P [Proteobacteria bacterium]|nr:elongation factor P [Pseudomonadota bacterium]MCP4920226.1 elongation factor P [Pseudomonadota bacterium]
MAHYYQTSDFRNGLKVVVDGNPFVMTYFQFVKPGKGTAFTRTKLKNLISGAVIERTYRTGEQLEAADCEEKKMQYQYQDGDLFFFMDMESYEQIGVPVEVMDGTELFLLDALEVEVMMYNDRPVGVELPQFIEAEITYCEPGAKGNTAQGATKPATVCNGAQVQVPLFINNGEVIKIDTKDKKYCNRVR